MTLYRLRPDSENYMSFHIENDELNYKMGDDIKIHFDPTPQKHTQHWIKPNGIFYKPDSFPNAVAIPDITIWAYYLVLSEKAYNELASKLEFFGEFLPVNCEGFTYHIFNILSVADELEAVDNEKSERNIIEGVYMGLKSLVFKDEKLKNTLLFRTAYDYAPIFSNDEFKQIIEDSGLKGLVFKTDLEGVL